jgi:hypothetical protein
MLAINEGGHFLFTETDAFARLEKYNYGGERLKTTASKNSLFLEADILRQPSP